MPGKVEIVFIIVSGVKGLGGTRTIFAAWVAGMGVIRGTRAARVLPKTTALIPMETQTPKSVGGGAVAAGGKIQPNPTANDFSQFVLGGQLGFEQVQDCLGGQLTVGAMGGEGAGF